MTAALASQKVAEKIKVIAAEMLEASPADIQLSEGRARVAGTEIGVAIADVARRAWQGFRLPEGVEPGLSYSNSYDPVTATFSYATHACRVAIDPGTGVVSIEDYVVVQDCGTMVNPTIVEGQIHGGVAQGLGAAFMEEFVYDDQGQPQSSTLLDYHVPASASIPDIRIEHTETPSPHTPGGMKGMGEGGTRNERRLRRGRQRGVRRPAGGRLDVPHDPSPAQQDLGGARRPLMTGPRPVSRPRRRQVCPEQPSDETQRELATP